MRLVPGAPIRRFALIVALLAVAAAVVAFVRAKPLPEAHTLSRAGRYYQPLDQVWAAVLDVGSYGTWRSDLASIERQPDVRGHEVWREVPKRGSPVTFETVETIKDRRLVRCVIDQGGDYGGCVTAEIIRRDDGAIVTFAERLTVHSAVFRFTNTVAGRRDRIDTWLRDLGQKFGEDPRIADLPKDLRDPPKPAVVEETPAAEAPAPPASRPVSGPMVTEPE